MKVCSAFHFVFLFFCFSVLLSACENPYSSTNSTVSLSIPVVLKEDMTFIPLAAGEGIRSDKRPTAAGFYDESVEKTFVTWLGEDSNPFVQAYDHQSATWTAPKRVGNIRRSSSFEGADSHNYPLLIQANDGRLLVFYAEHSDELRLAASPQASSLEGEWSDTVIDQAPAASYPMPVKVANGDIYVFYRESSYRVERGLENDDRPLQYILSRDNGISWKSSAELTGERIALGSWDRSDNLDEIYVGQIRYQQRGGLVPERIHLVWTIAGGGREGPRHNRYHKNVYYSYFQPSNKHFYCADWRDLGQSISKTDMEYCLVEDTGPPSSRAPHAVGYVQLVHYTKGTSPLLVYPLETSEGNVTRVARWERSSWVYSDIDIDGSPMDIERLSADTFTLYLGKGEIRVLNTRNGGTSWQLESSFSLPTNKGLGNLYVVDNFRDPARLLITETTSRLTPDADIFLVGGAKCLITGNFRLKDAWGENYLGVNFNDSSKTILGEYQRNDRGQIWRFSDANGNCKLQNLEYKSYLGAVGDIVDAEVTLRSPDDMADEYQQWMVKRMDNGDYKIENVFLSEMYLRSSDKAVGNEADVIAFKQENDKSQRWQLEPAD